MGVSLLSILLAPFWGVPMVADAVLRIIFTLFMDKGKFFYGI